MALRDSRTFMWQHDWNEQGGACLPGREEHIIFGDRNLSRVQLKSRDPTDILRHLCLVLVSKDKKPFT